jgi:hypothetical protein
MTEKEFRKTLKDKHSFKNEEEEVEFLLKVIQYWLTNYSPPVHSSVVLPDGKLLEIGWLKDITLIKGGNQELKLMKYAFDSIKKNIIFAD